ncbi:Kunitz/Bovine pancreatic trypsin inhibitor domain protein [Ancylostoma caninum]|uniref:Kunitz/Bovine pancreatic trypsin inhibitor domain protein n=1 Tax=Ancylostoma caninum TaxID=29170 RepID=A0A368FUS6_ANCCA|nr:Kunitz/Bovine pancreatic trypsin inhibitor domain protein [Ancylostoma caninum]
MEMLPVVAALALASGVYSSSNPCTLQLASGPCRASIQRFYFDKKQKKCTHFQYRRKSKRHPYPLHTNNFEFISDCIRTCVEGKHREPDLKAILAANGIYYQ